MDLIISVLTVIFVAVLIGTAFTFGAALLVAVLILSFLAAAFFVIRQQLARWAFIRTVKQREAESQNTTVTIIETEYTDITDINPDEGKK
jgi:hypothetical protein